MNVPPPLPQLLAVAKLGATVLLAFAVCWAPWLHSRQALLQVGARGHVVAGRSGRPGQRGGPDRDKRADDASTAPLGDPDPTGSTPGFTPRRCPLPGRQVLSRIFPVRRGLYEDYVANWWCASSAALKWKSRFPPHLLLRAAAATTLAAAAPAMAHQIAGGGGGGGGGGGPSRWGLVRCLVNSGFAFYMFSYQVGTITHSVHPCLCAFQTHRHMNTSHTLVLRCVFLTYTHEHIAYTRFALGF